MSVIRLYLDEDAMNSGLVEALRSRDLDAVSAIEARMIGMPDEKHLRWATTAGRVLYSFSQRDFYRSTRNGLREVSCMRDWFWPGSRSMHSVISYSGFFELPGSAPPKK